jgi:hypothetical protein
MRIRFFDRKEKARRSPSQGRKSSPNVNHLLNALIRLHSRETFRGRVGMHNSFLRCAHDGNVTLTKNRQFSSRFGTSMSALNRQRDRKPEAP